MPMARIGKRGMDEWAQFPLDTADNIRKWQRVCTGQDAAGPSQQARLDEHQAHVRADCPSDRKRKRVASETSEDRLIKERVQYPGAPYSQGEREGWSSTSNNFYPSPEQPHAQTHRNPSIERIEPNVIGTVTTRAGRQIQDDPPSAVQMSSSWEGAPSLGFQQTFLW